MSRGLAVWRFTIKLKKRGILRICQGDQSNPCVCWIPTVSFESKLYSETNWQIALHWHVESESSSKFQGTFVEGDTRMMSSGLPRQCALLVPGTDLRPSDTDSRVPTTFLLQPTWVRMQILGTSRMVHRLSGAL